MPALRIAGRCRPSRCLLTGPSASPVCGLGPGFQGATPMYCVSPWFPELARRMPRFFPRSCHHDLPHIESRIGDGLLMTHDQRRPNRREFLGSVSGSTVGAVLGATLSGSAWMTCAAQQQAANSAAQCGAAPRHGNTCTLGGSKSCSSKREAFAKRRCPGSQAGTKNHENSVLRAALESRSQKGENE